MLPVKSICERICMKPFPKSPSQIFEIGSKFKLFTRGGMILTYNELIHWVIMANTSGEMVSSIVAYSTEEPVSQC